MLEHVEKLEAEHFVISALAFVALFAPGVIAIALFFPDHFMKMSTAKLVFSSFSVGIPLTVPHICGAIAVIWNEPRKLEDKVRILPFMSAAFGLLASLVGSYSALIVAYLVGAGLKLTILLFLISHGAITYGWWKAIQHQRAKHAAAA